MSIIKETIRSVSLGAIPGRIATYLELVQSAEPLFNLNGKGLEQLCKEHSQNLMYYDLMLQECKMIEDTVRMKLEELEAEIYKQLNEKGSRVLGATDIRYYMKGDPRYVAAMEILLEVVHAKKQLESVVEALKQLGWGLANIVKLRIAQLEDTVI